MKPGSFRSAGSSLVTAALNVLPPIKALVSERDALRAQLGELTALQNAACYDHDGMRLHGRSTDFLRDERFVRAYEAGMDSGHKIGRPPGSHEDIHIEWRVHIACWAACHALHLPGDFVECGVNTGIFSLAICYYLDFNATEKSFYLFDTFRGIPEEQMLDTERAPRLAENQAAYEECYETARRNFEQFPRARLVRGRVPDSLSDVSIEKVCYLSLDMNIAAPEIAAIGYFWDKLVSGAVVLLDDYGWANYFEQKKAMDAFASRMGVAIACLPTGQGLLIKP